MLLLSPEHRLWIIKNWGVSIDHQTISLGAEGILEYVQKYLVLTRPRQRFLVIEEVRMHGALKKAWPSLNISQAAAAALVPLKHKRQTRPALHNGWNNKVFIVRNYCEHLSNGRQLRSGAAPVNGTDCMTGTEMALGKMDTCSVTASSSSWRRYNNARTPKGFYENSQSDSFIAIMSAITLKRDGTALISIIMSTTGQITTCIAEGVTFTDNYHITPQVILALGFT